MARKKSAARKARDAAKKEALLAETEDVAPVEKIEKTEGNINSGSEESSSSEDEDDFGELVTEEVEEGINKVLAAIKNNDTKTLLDPKSKFFEDPETAASKIKKPEKEKPIYLKDYHRMNLLAGNTFAENDDTNEDFDQKKTVDGEQSYVSQQKEEKERLLSEINDAFGGDESGDDENDDAFLTKKSRPETDKGNTPANLPDPTVDEEKFLDAFVNEHAWIPKKGDKEITLDGVDGGDDDDFEHAVEDFEHAYNFRYEDPNSAEIISYARNQATLRRSDTSSRRRKREAEKEEKIDVKTKKEKAINKKENEKVNQITDVLEQLKQEYGAEIDEKMVKKITDTLLNSDFSTDSWDQVVSDLFNDEFYEQEGKPTWDDDDEIMKDYKQEDNVDVEMDNEAEGVPEKQSRQKKKEEKSSKRKEKKELSKMVEKVVQDNKLQIIEEVEKEEAEKRGRSKERDNDELKFRYREVSPESYGLSVREIFTADDADLNQYIGLKKFAPYRPKDLRDKDKRKVTKSKRLKEWRKTVFNNEEGLVDDGGISIPVKNKRHSKHDHRKNKKQKSKK